MLEKKNLVLLSLDEGDEKAVLSMQCDGDMLKGRVRLYNFNQEPKGIISLGIFGEGKVIKAGLTKESNMLYSFQTALSAFPKNFSCAVVNFKDGEIQPLLFGANEGSFDKEEIFAGAIEKLKDSKSMSEVENILDEEGIDFDDEEKEEIEKAIDKELGENHCDCANCKYKKFFFEQERATISAVENPEEKSVNEEILKQPRKLPSFYDEIKPQIDKLFEKNPTEEYLQEMFPNSKWVKVEFEESGDYYVFGLLYDEDRLKYVCYGVPGIYQKIPPRELSGYPVWFPLDSNKRDGFGYWLSYQDAQSGESVKAVVE